MRIYWLIFIANTFFISFPCYGQIRVLLPVATWATACNPWSNCICDAQNRVCLCDTQIHRAWDQSRREFVGVIVSGQISIWEGGAYQISPSIECPLDSTRLVRRSADGGSGTPLVPDGSDCAISVYAWYVQTLLNNPDSDQGWEVHIRAIGSDGSQLLKSILPVKATP